MLAPSIFAAASIVFLFTFTSFGIALLLSDPAHATIEVEIYSQVNQFGDLHIAAALAFVQAVAVLVFVFAMARAQERRAVAQRLVGSAETSRRPRGGERVLVAVVLVLTVLFLGGPVAVLVWRSLHVGGQWSLASYRALGTSASASTLFVSPWAAVRNSLVFAAIATVIALVVGGLASFAIAARPGRGTRSVDALLMMPLGVSAVTVGFGYLIAFDRGPRARDLAVARAHCPRGDRGALRDPRRRTRAAQHRRAAARRGDDARRVAAVGCGGRSTSRSSRGRSSSRPGSRRRCRWASSARRCSSRGPTGRRCRSRSNGSSSRPGEINVAQSLAMSVILMAMTAAVILAIERVRVRQLGEL